jgi:hypothetical protein
MKIFSVYEYDYGLAHPHGLFSTEAKALDYVDRIVAEGRVKRVNLEVCEWEVDDLST